MKIKNFLNELKAEHIEKYEELKNIILDECDKLVDDVKKYSPKKKEKQDDDLMGKANSTSYCKDTGEMEKSDIMEKTSGTLYINGTARIPTEKKYYANINGNSMSMEDLMKKDTKSIDDEISFDMAKYLMGKTMDIFDRMYPSPSHLTSSFDFYGKIEEIYTNLVAIVKTNR